MIKKMILGNCFDELENLKNKSVNLFIIDPPYFIGYKKWDKKGNDEFQRFFHKLLPLINQKLTDDGTAWFFMAKDNLFRNKDKKVDVGLIEILEVYGHVHLDNWVTWGRQKGRGSKKKLKSMREEIIHYTKTDKYIWNDVQVLREVVTPYVKNGRPRGWFINADGFRVRWTGLGNVWMYSSPQWNGILDKQRHSAQKPFLICERLILLSSCKGHLVVEPFMGAGISSIVASYHKRDYIGIEIDEAMYNDTCNFVEQNYEKIIKEYELGKLNFEEQGDENDLLS